MASSPTRQNIPKAQQPSEPVLQRDISPEDVAKTPLTDLNIDQKTIPQLLIAAQSHPYDLTGFTRCSQFASAIGELDALLGDDLDITAPQEKRIRPGRLAQSVLGFFIPLRGVIREVSGASEYDRKLRVAFLAGSVRRGFLKGVGQQMGCNYPARAMVPASFAMSEKTQGAPIEPAYVSRPVVQSTVKKRP